MSAATSENAKRPRPERVRRIFAVLLPVVLFGIWLWQTGRAEHPTVTLGERYVVRLERIDQGDDFVFFKTTWWDNVLEFSKDRFDWMRHRLGWGAYSSHIYAKTFVSMTHYTPENHFGRTTRCLWLSIYDKNTGKYLESDDRSCLLDLVDGSATAAMVTSLHETKGGKHVRGLALNEFLPGTPVYHVRVMAWEEGALLRVNNPLAAEPVPLPAWSGQTTPLPATKTAGGMEVTLDSFKTAGTSLWSAWPEPGFVLKKNGQDVTRDFEMETQIEDAWGNGTGRFRRSAASLRAPAWRISLRFSETGTAPFPPERLCDLGKLSRPAPQTMTPVNMSWQSGTDESLDVLAVLGAGEHFFAENRWVRARATPAGAAAGRETGDWETHTEEAEDETGRKVPLRSCWTRGPALLPSLRTDNRVSLLPPGNGGLTGNQRAHEIFKILESNWVIERGSRRVLLPVHWPDSEHEKSLTLGISQQREVSFYAKTEEVRRLMLKAKKESEDREAARASIWGK